MASFSTFPPDFFFIPELGSDIFSNLEKTYSIIDRLKKNKVKAIKIQHLYAEEIILPQIKNVHINGKEVDLYDHFTKSETSLFTLKKVKNYCEKKGLVFISSFFGDKSFTNLKKLNTPIYKIASPESSYKKLWLLAKQTQKPIFFSIGVKLKKDLDDLFNFFKKKRITKKRLTMFHCVSSYPTPVNEYNLNLIYFLAKEYRVNLGISDHSDNPYLIPMLGYVIAKIMNKTFFIEKHYVEKKENGIDDRVAIDNNELQHLAEYISRLSPWIKKEKILLNKLYLKLLSKESDQFAFSLAKKIIEISKIPITAKKIKKILGEGKKGLAQSERSNYTTTNRSLIAIKNIEKNEKITFLNSSFLRAEKKSLVGLNYSWEEKLGKIYAARKINRGSPIKKNNIIEI